MIMDRKKMKGINSAAISACCTALLWSGAGLYADSTSTQPESGEPDLFRNDKAAFFAQAEYLYWAVDEGALDYAVKMNQPAWSQTVDTYAVGHYHNADFDWASGLRIALGYYRALHFWDMFLQYIYVPSFGSNEVHAPHESDEFLNGTFAEPVVAAPYVPLERASSRISLDYHVLDFLCSRRFYPNPHLRMNLYGGIASAFLYQNWNVYYEDIQNQHAKIRNRWQFEGLGLKLGVKLDWYLGWDTYLTGLASSGILSGWYKNSARVRTQAVTAGANPSLPIQNTHFQDTRLAYNAQIMGGFSWQKAYKSVRAEIGLGYEFNIWANLHQIYRTSLGNVNAVKQTLINDSNLCLQGLTARANLDF